MASGLLDIFSMAFMFEKLEVYQRAIDFADRVMPIAGGLPRGQRAFADQFKRASLSIPLNIAEGNGRWHPKERKNFFLIARGSVFECVPLLELCYRQKWISDKLYKDIRNELETMGKMLTGLIKGIGKRREH